MTCETFRHLMRTDNAFCNLSRAERVASSAHYAECRECKKWIRSQPDKPVSADEALSAVLMAISDMQDPEAL